MGHLNSRRGALIKRIAHITKKHKQYQASKEHAKHGISDKVARYSLFGMMLAGLNRRLCYASIMPEWDIWAIISEAQASGDIELAKAGKRIAFAARAKHGSTMQL